MGGVPSLGRAWVALPVLWGLAGRRPGLLGLQWEGWPISPLFSVLRSLSCLLSHGLSSVPFSILFMPRSHLHLP